MSAQPSPAEPYVPGAIAFGCLVLAPADDAPPQVLLKALGSRGLSARVVQDEPSLMAMLADKSRGRRVLIVVNPGRWHRLAELVRAVQTYHPEALCWRYDDTEGRPPRLATLDQRVVGPKAQPLSAAGPNGHADANGSSRDAGGAVPVGRIVGRRRAIDALLTRVPGRPLSTREVVTRQELTMLLGPATGEVG